MVTDAMIAAARDEFIAVVHGFYYPSNEQIRCVLEAAEKAAWRPISEWDGKRGFAIVADCFGSQPAEFDPDPTLEDFMLICGEGEGEKEFAEYLEEFPGEGWRTMFADEVEYLNPTMFRPLPTPPEASHD